jgi:hypothetical protein
MSTKVSSSKTYSIKAAANKLNLSEVYIRRLISQDKLETNKVYISTQVWRHEITEEALLALEAKHTQTRTMRNDGRNKYTVYANAAEFAKLTQIAKVDLPSMIIEKANKPQDTKKRYLAQKAKKAALRNNTK